MGGWGSISVTFTWTECVGGVQVVSLGPRSTAPTSWGILFLMVLPPEDIRGLLSEDVSLNRGFSPSHMTQGGRSTS